VALDSTSGLLNLNSGETAWTIAIVGTRGAAHSVQLHDELGQRQLNGLPDHVKDM
jgi:hypothetical protein